MKLRGENVREGLLYVAIAFVGVLPALLHPGAIVGDGIDAYGSHWFYWWMRLCIEHGINPAWTNLFFYPSGKDIFTHTGLNLVDATLSVPFQWVFGPTWYQPILIVFLQLGNAVAMRALARDVLGPGRAAVTATVLWMTNPYAMGELTEGRPTQAFLWFIPAAVLSLRRVAAGGGWRDVAGLGVSVALAGWTYWFNGYFLVFLLLPLAAFALRDTPNRRRTLARWAAAAVICATIVGPAVRAMARLHRSAKGAADPGGIFDLPAGLGESGAFSLRGWLDIEAHGAPFFLQPAWGLGLLGALILGTPALDRRAKRVWIVALLVMLAIAIGPAFGSGEDATVWPPYMVLYRYLPFFSRLWFPYRALGVAAVPASLLIGALAARWRALPALVVALSLAGQAYVCTWPFGWHVATAPPLLAALRAERGALIYMPFKSQNDALMWQTAHQRPTFGGMGESNPDFWPPDLRSRLSNGFVRSLRGATMVPPQPARFTPMERKELERTGFRWVALRMSLLDAEFDRRAGKVGTAGDHAVGRADAVARVSAIVGSEPVGVDADVVLWDMEGTWTAPEGSGYTPEKVAAIPWNGRVFPAFERRVEELGRKPPDAPQERGPPGL